MAQPRIVLTNYGVKHWMILNTDKLWLVKVIFFIVSLISQYLAFHLRTQVSKWKGAISLKI